MARFELNRAKGEDAMASVADEARQFSQVAANVQPYLELIESFLAGRLSSDEFEERYRTSFLADFRSRPEALYDILNAAFLDAESYFSEAVPEDRWLIDEDELRARMQVRLAELRDIRN